VTDAILGALAVGDIGAHFSDKDERWANADSFVFLREAVRIMREKGFRVVNLDSVVNLEAPKLRPHIERMRANLARALEIEIECVSVKAAMRVFILKEGKEYNQGVAYLDDGTMVVVDNARRLIGKTADVAVTSVLQTTAGKMIFGRLWEDKEDSYETSNNIHESRLPHFRSKSTRELRQTTIVEEME
jgi:hypothetical protein